MVTVDEGHSQQVPPWERPQHYGIPADARRIGLDRNTLEGAMLAFSGSLDRTKRSHLLTAWVLLLMFSFPVVLTVIRLSSQLFHALAN